MALATWMPRQNRMGTVRTAPIALDALSQGRACRLVLDHAAFDLAAQKVAVAIEISRDGGATWELWLGATFVGGPVLRGGREVGRSDGFPADATHIRAGVAVTGIVDCGLSGEFLSPAPFFPPSQPASVAFDAASSAYGANVTSLSWSHTCTGAELGLIVGASLYAPSTVSALTYGGAALTSIGAVQVAADSRAEQWRKVAPATGVNTVAITLSGTTSCVGGAVSATSVDQTTPVGTQATATGNSSTPSVTVTAATGDLVVDVVAFDPVPTIGGTVGAGQTKRWDTGATSDLGGLGSTESGAASVVMDWTLTGGAAVWAQCGVAFKATAGLSAGEIATAAQRFGNDPELIGFATVSY